MKFLKSGKSKKLILLGAILAIAGFAYVVFGEHYTLPFFSNAQAIDNTSGNYGFFIDNTDDDYFSTRDANVRKIIRTYLTNPHQFANPTDAQKYGFSLVYYYDKSVFIVAEKTDSGNNNSVADYVIHDMKTGLRISDCSIFTSAGLHKNTDLLLSVSFEKNDVSTKNGVCLYERGASNFTFVDLTSKLSRTETFFNDPSGRNLKANIKNVNMQQKTFVVDVYDKNKRGADGNYVYKRSIESSF